MKTFIIISLLLYTSLSFMSCNPKDDGTPTSSDIQFSLDPQINKYYNFQSWILDSLDQKKEGPYFYYDKNVSKNLSIGGKNDAFLTLTYNSQFDIDSAYLRVENGKDVYEWADTSQIFFESAAGGMRNILTKITQSEVWVARVILSKGNGAEYVLLPKRFYPVQVSPDLTLNVSFEMIGKNEGFEDVTVPAGKFKAYKVKILVKAEAYLGTQVVDKINFIQYIWINDEIDWFVKQYLPTVKSSMMGVIEPGVIKELVSIQ